MDFSASVKSGFSRYVDFKTRSSRSEFWWWMLFVWGVSIALVIVNSLLFGATVEQSNSGGINQNYDGGVLGSIFSLGIFIPSLAVSCRRLHDLEKSGWWQLIVLVPIIGFFLLLYWYVQPGGEQANRFGANPLADTIDGSDAVS